MSKGRGLIFTLTGTNRVVIDEKIIISQIKVKDKKGKNKRKIQISAPKEMNIRFEKDPSQIDFIDE